MTRSASAVKRQRTAPPQPGGQVVAARSPGVGVAASAVAGCRVTRATHAYAAASATHVSPSSTSRPVRFAEKWTGGVTIAIDPSQFG